MELILHLYANFNVETNSENEELNGSGDVNNAQKRFSFIISNKGGASSSNVDTDYS